MMKKFENPIIKIKMLDFEDVATTSGIINDGIVMTESALNGKGVTYTEAADLGDFSVLTAE